MSRAVLKNEWLTVEISNVGAEIQSVRDRAGREYIWNGDPAYWPSRTPMLFPIVGGLKDDKFIYREKEYHLKKHGFTRNADFVLEDSDSVSAVFLLSSTPETEEGYPFQFELRVIYRLMENSIQVTYQVKNKTAGEMYFSIGAHEGYACPEGIGNYYLEFDREETAQAIDLNGNLLTSGRRLVLDHASQLDLDDSMFANDAVIFEKMASRGVTLKSRTEEKSVHVAYEGFDYIGIWTKENAPYLCIEPWAGIPDFESHNYELTEKAGIIRLEENGVCEKVHTLTFA